MRDLLATVAEPLVFVVYGALVSVLTAVGLGAELLGLSDLLVGGSLQTVALWYVYLGAVALAAAVVVARRRLLPLLGSRSGQTAGEP